MTGFNQGPPMTPISDDMVEKAARGIAALVGNEAGRIWEHMKPVYYKEARAALTAALEGSVVVPAIGLGSIVEMHPDSPYASDWRGAIMKVVSLRIDPEGHKWVSVIEGDQRHRGNGVYDGETTDIEADHLQIVSTLPRK